LLPAILGVLFFGMVVAAYANQPPQILSIDISPIPQLGGQRIQVRCIAIDPEGGTLSYAWATTDGTLEEADDGDSRAIWVLPAAEGNFQCSVVVTDSLGASRKAERLVPIGPIYAFRRLSGRLTQPTRVAVDTQGTLWIADAARARVVHLADNGQLLGEFPTASAPISIAIQTDGTLLVGESGRARVARYNPDGTFRDALGNGVPAISQPSDIDVDPISGRIYVVDSKTRYVRIFSSAGNLLSNIGGTLLEFPVAVKVNPAAGEIYIADQATAQIFVFNPSGQRLRTLGGLGNAPGQFVRIQGLALDADGNLFALDSFQNNVQVIRPDGEHVATFGQLGNGSGAFRTPLGIAAIPGQQVFVTSSGTGEIQVFGYWSWMDPNQLSTTNGMVLF